VTLGRARVLVTLLDRSTGRMLGDIGRRALFQEEQSGPGYRSQGSAA